MATTHSQENERLARRVPEELATEKNVELLEELYAEDAVEHGPTGDERGHAEIREGFDQFLAAFPDISATVQDVVTEGDTVAMRVRLRGTHEGPFVGLEPTNRTFDVENMVFTRIADGKIVERWVQPDMLGLMRQLGVIDSPMA